MLRQSGPRILWINPVGHGRYDASTKQVLEKAKRDDVVVDVVHLSKGPPHLEYKSLEPYVVVEILETIKRGEKSGYDAAVIACFADPGVREARELVNIPVVGPGEVCYHLAHMLGHRFSVVTTRRGTRPRMEDTLFMYGLEKRLASFRFINILVPDLQKDPSRVHHAITRESLRAIEEDGAEVIILGCTIESGFTKELIGELKVPVIDATIVPFKHAEMLADLYRNYGISHSKVGGYKTPPQEEIPLRH